MLLKKVLIQLSKVVWMQWKHSMLQAKVLMLHLVMALHQKAIWDQDLMDQWDLHQKAIWDQDLMDQWDLLQVKADHLQGIWDQDLMDQWDHLQGIWDQDLMDQWGHLQGIWDQGLMDQWGQIHYLVIVDQPADHLRVIQEDLLQEIL